MLDTRSKNVSTRINVSHRLSGRTKGGYRHSAEVTLAVVSREVLSGGWRGAWRPGGSATRSLDLPTPLVCTTSPRDQNLAPQLPLLSSVVFKLSLSSGSLPKYCKTQVISD